VTCMHGYRDYSQQDGGGVPACAFHPSGWVTRSRRVVAAILGALADVELLESVQSDCK
jgi:hypothetical protein